LNFAIKKEVQQGRIRGINLPGAQEDQIIAQFADDTFLTIRGEETYVQATVLTLQQFSLALGLVINESKSTAYFWAPNHAGQLGWAKGFRWQ
jgi:hypothetical protein